MKCVMIPSDSEFHSVDLTLDYKAAEVAGRQFVLPSQQVRAIIQTIADSPPMRLSLSNPIRTEKR